MRDLVATETARLCAQVYRNRVRAIVLTGSLARNEGTFVNTDDGCALLGDAEFLLVFTQRSALASNADLTLVRQKIEERLSRHGLRAEVTLSAVRPEYFHRLPPSIFAYELRTRGDVIAGDRDLLRLIPAFGPDDIPREDAWRLLANRLVEQLESAEELVERRATLTPAAHYRTVKLYLDMATSALIFIGGYAPTYAERARNLAMVQGSPSRTGALPFPLEPFSEAVRACTRWKLSAGELFLDPDRTFWVRAIDYAQALWEWELTRLLPHDDPAAPDRLLRLWARRQPLRQRLRGWAYVARTCGWHRDWRQWPRWVTQARQGSPRHLVYAIGSRVLFELGAGRPLPDIDDLRQALPVPGTAGPNGAQPAPHHLAEAVVHNYKRFVVGTRS
jgi:hypothetical protein